MIFTRNKIHVIREELYLENPYVQWSLEACSSWGHKEPDMTEQLNAAHSTEKGKGDRGEERNIEKTCHETVVTKNSTWERKVSVSGGHDFVWSCTKLLPYFPTL